MFFDIAIFFQGLAFFALLRFSVTEFGSDFFSFIFEKNSIIGAVLFLVAIGYVFRSAYRISRKGSMTALPVLFFFASLGLLYFISSPSQQKIFIIASSAVYYFLLIAMYRLKSYEKDQTAIGIMGACSLITLFFLYSALCGIYLNFVFPLGALMAVFLLVTTLVSFQYLWILKKDLRMVWSYSLVLGLIMTEIAWILNFWPFGYLTTGVVALIFYYVFWDLVCKAFKDTLSKKGVFANIVIFSVLASVVLMSSHWLPVV